MSGWVGLSGGIISTRVLDPWEVGALGSETTKESTGALGTVSEGDWGGSTEAELPELTAERDLLGEQEKEERMLYVGFSSS